MQSLEVLREAKRCGVFTKSSIMLGLGETDEEVRLQYCNPFNSVWPVLYQTHLAILPGEGGLSLYVTSVVILPGEGALPSFSVAGLRVEGAVTGD